VEEREGSGQAATKMGKERGKERRRAKRELKRSESGEKRVKARAKMMEHRSRLPCLLLEVLIIFCGDEIIS